MRKLCSYNHLAVILSLRFTATPEFTVSFVMSNAVSLYYYYMGQFPLSKAHTDSMVTTILIAVSLT